MVNLLALLGSPRTDVTLARYLGDDGLGAGTYGAAVTVSPVRVEPHAGQTQLSDGRVVLTSHVVSVPGSLDPQVGDRVMIGGVAYRVWTVDTPVWLNGIPIHHKVKVGPS